mmetsp:Transcript_156427/g.501871  ORF Transcript_156427/g.501871 Transcript_156427/m.501871 type:complete len:142 (-) Transcript_156427:21-446(-)
MAKTVKKYVDDPFCGHDCSVGFWTSAVASLLSLKKPETYAQMPCHLPVCLIAGSQDFCSIDDSGVPSHVHVQQELAEAGKAAPKVIVYTGARHELLLELNSEEVIEDLKSFFVTCLSAPNAKEGCSFELKKIDNRECCALQ